MARRILYIINVCCALLLLGVYVGAMFPEGRLSVLSLLGYVYPILLAVNATFALLWLFWRWRNVFLPLAVILIGWDYVPRLVGTSSCKEVTEQSFKILSCNVELFRHKAALEKSIIEENIDSVLSLIRKEQPDIVCLQEYVSLKKPANSVHRMLTDSLGFRYHTCSFENAGYLSGNAIYSKRPITRSGRLFPLEEENYSPAFADIKLGKKSLRLVNAHLTSYQLAEEEKQDVAAIAKGRLPDRQTSRGVVSKLLYANRKRAAETDRLTAILRENDKACVLVGDMNSTPYSYTYRELSKLMRDSFRGAGRGFGGTYNGQLPSFRIDYVFHTDGLRTLCHRVGYCDFSDHRPVIVQLEYKEEK